jgi:hypothetical protein
MNQPNSIRKSQIGVKYNKTFLKKGHSQVPEIAKNNQFKSPENSKIQKGS